MKERLNSTDLIDYGLKGKVKKIMQREFILNFSNDTIYTLELNNLFSASHYSLEFNELGNLNFKNVLNVHKDSIFINSTKIYKYDKQNRILQEKLVFPNTEYTSIWNYKYIGDDKINVQKIEGLDTLVFHKYEIKGNIEYLTYDYVKNTFIDRKLYVYDNFNRIIRFEDYGESHYIMDLKIFTYNNTINRKAHNVIYGWTLYEESQYDENNNLIKIIDGNFENEEKRITHFKNKYDYKGNWIERKVIGDNDKLYIVLKREIEYFE
jgi:hypothetical protein